MLQKDRDLNAETSYPMFFSEIRWSTEHRLISFVNYIVMNTLQQLDSDKYVTSARMNQLESRERHENKKNHRVQ